jgi:hypothetical protein
MPTREAQTQAQEAQASNIKHFPADLGDNQSIACGLVRRVMAGLLSGMGMSSSLLWDKFVSSI